MTTIVISRDNKNSYRYLTCMGHAGYGRRRLFGYEPDILCAAVSALVEGTLNSLEELGHEELEVSSNEETGFIRCKFPEQMHENSVFLIDSLIFNLENLSREYGQQYLQVHFEEV